LVARHKRVTHLGTGCFVIVSSYSTLGAH